MDYRTIKNKNYNLHIINTDKFKTINLMINFKRKIKKEEITIRNLLNDILINTSMNYKTSRDIEIETEELYDLSISSNPHKSGNYHIISFKESFLNEKYTEDGMNLKSMQFLLELIFNANVSDNKFDKKYFELIKRTIEDDIKSLKDDTKKYSLIRLYEEIDSGPLSYRTAGYLEDLDKITETNLYDYYKSVIENDIIDIFVIGNINDTYEQLFNKYIPDTIRIKDNTPHYLNLEINDEQEKRELTKINQSKLSIGLKIKDITDYELKYVVSLYSLILGGSSNSKLFKVVREENSLCYYINSSVSVISKIITIMAGINSKDYEQTMKLIRNELNNIKEGNFSDSDIKEAKKIYTSGCKEIYDSPGSIINNYLSYEYANLDLAIDRINNIKNVTKEEIVALANKVVIDTIFLLEGTGSDEEANIM